MLKRLASAWATKWDGRWASSGGFHLESSGGTVLVFEVKPTKILAFAKGTFGVTRHQF
jgi:hypothetical protein